MREEASDVCGVVTEADCGDVRGEQEPGAEQQEGSDGEEFERGKNVFDRPEGADVERVDEDQRGREQHDPEEARHGGEPETHVQGDGRNLCAQREDDAGPVGPADEEPGEGVEVDLGPVAKGAGGGVGDGHLGQAAHEQQRDERADEVRHQHGRAGERDGESRAEEQARADGAADGDHRKLGGRQGAAQAGFAVGEGAEGRVWSWAVLGRRRR